MKDDSRDPNTLELFPEVIESIEKIFVPAKDKRKVKPKIKNSLRKKLIKELKVISKNLEAWMERGFNTFNYDEYNSWPVEPRHY